MSYEDLEEARLKRAEKEAAKNAKGKGKRGRKLKNVTLEAKTEAEVAAGDNKGRGQKRKKLAQEEDVLEAMARRARVSEALEQSIALIAKMI